MKEIKKDSFIDKLTIYLKQNKIFSADLLKKKKSLTSEDYQMIIEAYCLYRQLIKYAVDKNLPIIIDDKFILISIYYQGITIVFKEYQDNLTIERGRIHNQKINYLSTIKRTKKI